MGAQKRNTSSQKIYLLRSLFLKKIEIDSNHLKLYKKCVMKEKSTKERKYFVGYPPRRLAFAEIGWLK